MPDRSWTLVKSTCVGEYPIVRLREDRYRLEPEGAESDFIVCQSSDWVLVVAITPAGEAVFVRQYRVGVRQVVLELPGGVLESGESPEEAAVRELREETGYEPGRVRHLARLMPNPALNDAYCHVVVAEDCRPTAIPSPDPFERIEVELHPLAELPEMIRSGQLVHALAIAALALLAGFEFRRPSP